MMTTSYRTPWHQNVKRWLKDEPLLNRLKALREHFSCAFKSIGEPYEIHAERIAIDGTLKEAINQIEDLQLSIQDLTAKQVDDY